MAYDCERDGHVLQALTGSDGKVYAYQCILCGKTVT